MAETSVETFVGEAGTRFSRVRSIAVLRGGGLGDLMFAMPGIAALAAAYPEATVTVLGTPAAKALLEGRPGPVDEVVVLPFAEGVRPGPEDPAALEDFFARMRERKFDLAVQIHGGGRYSNPFLLKLGARHTVGTRTPDAEALERNLPYIYYQNEAMRGLEVAGLAGAPARNLEARLEVTDGEREAAERHRDAGARGLLTIHPGATDPRRRWPAENFGEVAAGAAADGWQVLIVGDDGDADAAEEIIDVARRRLREQGAEAAPTVTSVAGKLSLPELLGVLALSDVMLGNDSGPRHLAMAVGTRTVGLFWLGNLINAGPLGRGLHRTHMSWVTHCPECGADVTQVGWTAERCEHDPSFLAGIEPAAVYADVRALMDGE